MKNVILVSLLISFIASAANAFTLKDAVQLPKTILSRTTHLVHTGTKKVVNGAKSAVKTVVNFVN